MQVNMHRNVSFHILLELLYLLQELLSQMANTLIKQEPPSPPTIFQQQSSHFSGSSQYPVTNNLIKQEHLWPPTFTTNYEFGGEEEDNPFLFPEHNLPPLDLCAHGMKYSPLDWQHYLSCQDEQSFQFDQLSYEAFYMVESIIASDIYCSSVGIFDPDTTNMMILGEDLKNGVNYMKNNDAQVSSVMDALFNLEHEEKNVVPSIPSIGGTSGGHGDLVAERRSAKTGPGREEKNTANQCLSRETISQYFYLPITLAAKELNIGVTLLKKRCRELGIRRWPHRKLMSLQTLIKNVKESGGQAHGGNGESKMREAIEKLEEERKLMEQLPDLELEKNTKRLRQSCFKANYKKKRKLNERPTINGHDH